MFFKLFVKQGKYWRLFLIEKCFKCEYISPSKKYNELEVILTLSQLINHNYFSIHINYTDYSRVSTLCICSLHMLPLMPLLFLMPSYYLCYILTILLLFSTGLWASIDLPFSMNAFLDDGCKFSLSILFFSVIHMNHQGLPFLVKLIIVYYLVKYKKRLNILTNQ